jgi:hypothetical protein
MTAHRLWCRSPYPHAGLGRVGEVGGIRGHQHAARGGVAPPLGGDEVRARTSRVLKIALDLKIRSSGNCGMSSSRHRLRWGA